MDTLDAEYRTNETRYRAALIAEDTERRDAGAALEQRGGREWAELVGQFEMRQVALALDEGRALDGATAEFVTELRGRGGSRPPSRSPRSSSAPVRRSLPARPTLLPLPD